jgi:hypothetical protein
VVPLHWDQLLGAHQLRRAALGDLDADVFALCGRTAGVVVWDAQARARVPGGRRQKVVALRERCLPFLM